MPAPAPAPAATSGTVVTAVSDGLTARLAVRVEGDRTRPDGTPSAVEYQASTPALDAQGKPKSDAQVQADLLAAVKVARDADRALLSPPAPTPLAIAGTVTL